MIVQRTQPRAIDVIGMILIVIIVGVCVVAAMAPCGCLSDDECRAGEP